MMMLWTTHLGSLIDDGGELGPGLKTSVEFESLTGDTDDGSIRARVERLCGGREYSIRHFRSLRVNGLKWC